MMERYKKKSAALLAAAPLLFTASLLSTPVSHAGGTFKLGPDKSLSIGMGLRAGFASVEDGSPNGDSRSWDFGSSSARLYIGGQVNKHTKVTFNTEQYQGGGSDVIDAIVQFEFNESVNIWTGRFLPPSDRSNFSGPYYLNMWDYPEASAYPSVTAGRMDGIAFWGTAVASKLKYQVGLFDSENLNIGGSPDDDPFLAARITYNILDPEPGYYNSSTYYGAKDVLALGFTLMSGADAANGDDYNAFNFDLLFEKKMGDNGGVLTAEAAIYDYEYAPVTGTAGFQEDVTAIMLLGAYLIPGKVGIGQLQPKARFQSIDIDNGGDRSIFDLQLDYIMDGHNARTSMVFSFIDPVSGDSTNALKIGVQLQI